MTPQNVVKALNESQQGFEKWWDEEVTPRLTQIHEAANQQLISMLVEMGLKDVAEGYAKFGGQHSKAADDYLFNRLFEADGDEKIPIADYRAVRKAYFDLKSSVQFWNDDPPPVRTIYSL